MSAEVVVVTGVSSGIGAGIAKVLIERGFHVFGSVRKEADAQRVSHELGTGFTPLLLDVVDEAAVARGVAEVRAKLGARRLAGLVNNAGISYTGPLLHEPLDEFRHQLEVNLIAPLVVAKNFMPLLRNDHEQTVGGPGRIVNISSVGGKFAAPFLGTYAASKHGLEGLSESLRRELMIYGVDVILVEPGYVNTAILDKAEAADYSAYDDTIYAASFRKFRDGFLESGRKGLEPRAIGEVVHQALTARRPKTSYTVMKSKLTQWTLPNLLPKRFIDRAIGNQLGLIRKA